MSTIHEDLRRVIIHDREFQKSSIDEEIYCVPVDEREELRLETQHNLVFRFMGNRLFLPRIENPRKILECGYGTGEWAAAVAEEYEDCQVTAVDIYPIQVDRPPNLELFSYNLNDRLNDPEVFERNAYDLIHSRFVGPGINTNRWRSYMRDMKMLLKPNGWVQIVEYWPNIQSWNGRLPAESSLTRWYLEYARAMEESDREPRVHQRLKQYMTDAGLRQVTVERHVLPIGGWNSDSAMAQLGRDVIPMVGELLDSLAIWHFPARLSGWTAAHVQTLTTAARAELQNTSLQLYIPVYIGLGRRSSRG